MAFLQILQQAEQFAFGHLSPLVPTILVFLGITFIWDCVYKRPIVLEAMRHLAYKLAAYITFFAIGHQLDRLVANSLLEFEDATQFFVAIWVLTKEVKHILVVLKHLGVDVPWILTSRTKMLEDTMKGMAPPIDEDIDAKIKELKESIEKLKELQSAGAEVASEVREVLEQTPDSNPQERGNNP